MDARQYTGGKYLKKEDAPAPKLFTIRGANPENVAQQGQPAENKLILYFTEVEKGLALNAINTQTCFDMFGSWETDQWIGHRVVIYNDPNVMMGTQRTGGLRLRAPRAAGGAAPGLPARGPAAPPPVQQHHTPVEPVTDIEAFDDDIPF